MDWDANTATQAIRMLAEQIKHEVDEALEAPVDPPPQLAADVLNQPQNA